MKKLKWLALILIVSLIFGMIACKQTVEPHQHVFAKEWTKDANYHWHRATCRHTSEVSDKAAHTFGDWTTTKEATEEAEGSRERTCSVCGYTATEAIEKLEHTHTFATEWSKDKDNHWYASTCGHDVIEGKAAHTFGDWTTTKEATCTQEGKKTVYCTVCLYEKEETIPAKGHSYSESRTKDASGHWYECDCGEKKDFEEHTYGTWKVTTEPTTNAEGKNERTCSNCGYVDSVVLQPAPEGFRFVKGTTITGEESWTPESKVFVSERKLTIPDLLVSDHEVTRGEYKTVMGSDPSTADAYDKNGTKLTEDAALNNPVN